MVRRCATSRTVPGSIPGGVTGFFSDIFPFDRNMALGSTQPLVKMSTRNIPRVKAAGVWGWQSHHLHVPNVMKYGTLNLLEPPGPVTGFLCVLRYKNINIHFWSYVAHFFLEWKMFQTKTVGKIKHVLCQITFVSKIVPLWDIWKNMVGPDRPQMTMWRMRFAC